MPDTIEGRPQASKRSTGKKSKKKKERKTKKTSRRKLSKAKSRKRHISSSSGSSSSLSSSLESTEEDKEKKRKKVSRKSKSGKEKVNPGASNSKVVVEKTPLTVHLHAIKQPVPDVGPHIELNSSKSRAPMTKEEYEKQQSSLKWVIDPETGRKRLIRGSGEVVEEIVSRERHQAINRQATFADGNFFQAQANLKARSSYD